MKKIGRLLLSCIIILFVSTFSISAFAVTVYGDIKYYWTGVEERSWDDNNHILNGYYYYPQNSVTGKKYNISVNEKHSYNANHVCTKCGHSCLHSDLAYVEPKTPTCVEDGNIGYWHCPACNGFFANQVGSEEISADSVIINAYGHDYVLGICAHCHEGDGVNGFNGSCGDTAFYWINSVGEMHIYGSGSIMDFDFSSPSPWSGHLDNIKTVIIEEGITSVGNQSFAECSNMVSVTFPHGILHIGEMAFTNCTLLSDIYFNGRQMEWHSITIGDNNEMLTNASLHCCYDIIINSGIVGGSVTATVEGEEVIEAIDGTPVTLTIVPPVGYELKTLSVKQGETEIAVENDSFIMPAGDISVTVIFHVSGTWGRINWSLNSDGLLRISGKGNMVGLSENSQDAWRAYSASIKKVEVENGVTSIGNYAFYACNEITDILITSDVSSIGNYAFSDCVALRSITIPLNVTSINCGAFQNCTSLTSVTIPDNVTDVCSYAFSGCNGLENILIPLSLNHVENSAFQNCSSLTNVYYSGTMEQWNEIVIEDSNDFLTYADIHFIIAPDFILPAELITIDNEAFAGGKFSYVKLPEQTVYIGWHAFADCPNLAYIYIPALTSQIDSQAFGDIQGLTIMGKNDTAAQTYAQDHNFSFVAVQ